MIKHLADLLGGGFYATEYEVVGFGLVVGRLAKECLWHGCSSSGILPWVPPARKRLRPPYRWGAWQPRCTDRGQAPAGIMLISNFSFCHRSLLLGVAMISCLLEEGTRASLMGHGAPDRPSWCRWPRSPFGIPRVPPKASTSTIRWFLRLTVR